MCTKCSYEPHDPISCENMSEWTKVCLEVNGSLSIQWVMNNTKDCSNCFLTIEKTGGRNAVRCWNCQIIFCWNCFAERCDLIPQLCIKPKDRNRRRGDLRLQYYYDGFAKYFKKLEKTIIFSSDIQLQMNSKIVEIQSKVPISTESKIGIVVEMTIVCDITMTDKYFKKLEKTPSLLKRKLEQAIEEPIISAEVDDSMTFQCSLNSQHIFAMVSLPLILAGLVLTGISIVVYTRPEQRKTTVRELCSMTRTRWALLFSFILSVFLSIPRFREQIINPYNGRPVPNKNWTENSFIGVINYFDDNVFNALIIFSLLLFINISIIALLKYSQFVRMRMTSQSSRDRRTTIMLIFVLLAYVGTHSPSMLIEYLDKNLTTQLPQEISILRKEISNFCMCLHPIFSFIDYLIFSEKYKATVKSLFMRLPKGTSSNNPPQAV
ncbi:Protein CBR-FRPR-13 [Caenorhabditis briggsae]|uniref:Protein CBR-FRPR-13 n=1 Tax=Caenorhabditis briggsae TaxID=6238 RepID=A8XUV9_CAEBR|nr:Protein CBR-FRPR-13 [Caenorhabditis briggsae]CAP36428.2 Protein CBR-FRPR-13 [Caenorhabditis briggsae]